MHLASPKFGLAQSIRRSRRTRQLHRGSQRTQLRKRAHPTEAGADLIAHARDLLERDANTQIAVRRFTDGWLGRVRIGTSMTVLMYALPPVLRQLKMDHPQLEISIKAGLTATTLQMLKMNALDLGLCALPIEDPALESSRSSLTNW